MSYVCIQSQILDANTMNTDQIIEALHYTGEVWRKMPHTERDELFSKARRQNPWFSPEYTARTFDHNANWLRKEALHEWTAPYTLSPSRPKTVGLVLAGNLPLVGFHDALSTLISGHKAQIKLSSQDSVLMRHFVDTLAEVEPELAQRVEITERLHDMEAVIATGSNNTSRYFQTYFGKYPHIIRQNRTSVGVITGKESAEELSALHEDMFSFYGLGCRNVSKIYLPEGYDPTKIISASEAFQSQIHHHKYLNNYEYNKSIYLVNGVPHYDSGYFMLKEDIGLHSPISVVYYEYYKDLNTVLSHLESISNQIQCKVGLGQLGEDFVAFGQAQHPGLTDYADHVDTLAFLSKL